MSQKTNLRIIIIDDNPAIHQDFMKILMKSKENINDPKLSNFEEKIFGVKSSQKTLPIFELNMASQGKEGVEMVAQALKEGNPYAVAFVDIRMPPGWDGIETIKHIWELDANIQIVICTAYSDYSWEETVNQLGERDNLLILKKPFDSVAVRQLACALTKKWQLSRELKNYTLSLEERVKSRTESLKKSLSLMQATLESSTDGIIVFDHNNKVVSYNKRFIDMWNLTKEIIDNSDFFITNENILNHLEEPDILQFEFEKLSKNTKEVNIGNIKLKDQRIFEFYTQPYLVNSKTLGRVWSFRDITKHVVLENELEYQATHDQLTKLPNRLFLLDHIKKAMVKSDKEQSSFGLMFLDLDRFKLINDSLSHEVGDEILRMVSERIKSSLSKHEILVRLGGDEFVILVEGIEGESTLKQIADTIISNFNQPFKIYQHSIVLTMSIGIAVYPKDGNNIEIILRNADRAMYHAKELGANQFQFYTSELERKNLDRLQKEFELRQALANNEFYLLYQPQFDLASEKLVSVEALIRWQHPEKGVILPIDFIPIAEESGLIIPIGEWVLRTACNQNKAWQKLGLPPIRMAVNITTKQIRLYNFTKTISHVLEETQLEPKYLELELTENMIINNEDIIQTVHDLKKMGIQIVLDDFGTGYSSLNYLREIPVDRLKIDQSYVHNIESQRGDDVIIQAIIAMAKSLNVEILAEGVENQHQLEFLKAQSCGEVQGFYFSEPISESECEKLLRCARGKFSSSKT